MIVLLLSLAGGIGALARFVLDGLIRTRLGRIFPWGTLIINFSGSFLLGLLAGLSMRHQSLTSYRTIIGTGFCGGYTTFSTANFETVRLIEKRRLGAAVFNTFGTLGLTLIGAGIGIALTI